MLMKTITRVFGLAAMAVAISLMPGIASAADVSDGAGFFGAEAISKANQTIREVEKKTGHEIRIETYATVPNDQAAAVAKMTKSERDTFFSNWEYERAQATNLRGLLILICKSPAQVRVWAGNPLLQAGFGKSEDHAIREPLVRDLKTKEYDKALAETAAQISTTFDQLRSARHSDAGIVNHSSAPAHPAAPAHPHRTISEVPQHHPAPAPHQSGFGGFLFVIAIIIGGVVLFSLIVRMFGGGGGFGSQGSYGAPGQMGYGGGPGYGYGYGGGGGGFMRSLAGGIFGAMAGNWLYDQFSGHHAQASDTNWSGHDSANAAAGYGQDDSWSNQNDSLNGGFSGGADFGDGDFSDSGGADFGGGSDFGGGDEF